MFVIHRLHDALSGPLIYNSATKPGDKGHDVCLGGWFFRHVRNAKLSGPAAMAGDGAPVTSRTQATATPSPEPDSQFQISDVGHGLGCMVKSPIQHEPTVRHLCRCGFDPDHPRR
jgi:hypothetical protein